jgi:hypothetical protein
MPWQMHDEEFANVCRFDEQTRYDYFVRRVADWEEIWVLAPMDTAAVEPEGFDGDVSVWPHPRFAEACVTTDGSGNHAEMIDLDDWIDGWLPTMEERGQLVVVFPVVGGRATLVEPAAHRSDILAELEKY